MKKLIGVSLGLFVVAAFGQSTPTHKKPTVKPSPLSHYMREVGLLFAEQLQTYDKACEDNDLPRCLQAHKDFQEDGTLKALADRMDIHLSESRPTAGDKSYRFLLTITYEAENLYLTRKVTWLILEDAAAKGNIPEHSTTEADQSNIPTIEAEMTESAKQSIPCMIEAHDIATKGVYSDSLGCLKGMGRSLQERAGAAAVK